MYLDEILIKEVMKKVVDKADMEELADKIAAKLPKLVMKSIEENDYFLTDILFQNKEFKQAFFNKLNKAFS